MKTKPLEFSIKDGKSKHCPFCQGSVGCSNYCLENGKYKGREFWCRKCNSKYSYLKHRRAFILRSAHYNLPTFNIQANYVHPSAIISVNLTPTDNIYILPCDRTGTYTSFDYSAKINMNRTLEFPITKEELEEKISLYVTFS